MEWQRALRSRGTSALLRHLPRLRSFATHARVRARGARRRPASGVPGMLSLVVPVYDVEEYLGACLSSLRGQHHTNVEIIVVDDGTPDDSVAIARRHRLRDPRVRIVHRPNGGLSAARNTGVAAARGEFIAFCDSDDTVPPDGYAAAVTSLQASGSDLAVLPYQRLRRSVVSAGPRWIQDAHVSDRSGVTLEQFPDIMVNAIVCSKVFRRSFWQRAGLRFVEGIIYEDQQVSAAAYARAGAFDVLSTPGYNWRSRGDRSGISQTKDDVASLRAQFKAADASLGVLARDAGDRVAAERLVQLLCNDLPQFSAHLPGCSDDFWEVLHEALPALEAGLPREVYLDRVPAQLKVLGHLVATGRRSAAEDFVLNGGLDVRSVRLGEEEVGRVMYLPLWRDPVTPVPDECFRLAETQTRPRSSVRAVTVLGPTTLRVRAWAVLQNLDLAEHPPRVTAVARCEGRDDVEVATETFVDPAIDEFREPGGSGHVDYRGGGVDLLVDTARLAAGAWTLQLTLTVGPVTRSFPLGRSSPLGSAGLSQALSAGPGRSATTSTPRSGWFTVTVYDDGPVADEVGLDTWTPGAWVEAAEVHVDCLLLTLRTTDVDAREHDARFVSSTGSRVGAVEPVDDRTVQVRLPFREPRTGGVMVPSTYAFRLQSRTTGEAIDPRVADELLGQLPLDVLADDVRVRVHLRGGQRRALAVEVLPPLQPDERGIRNELRLREVANAGLGDDPSVFFASFDDVPTLDDVRALHDELSSSGSALTRYWSVSDRSVPVPTGAVPLVAGTAQWYARLGAARYVVLSGYQPAWYRKTPGQVIVQVPGRYPGNAPWMRPGVAPARVASHLDRASDWDFLVSPASYATPILLRELPPGSAVTVLETGSPRHAELVRSDDTARRRARELLGIGADQVAVLWAPQSDAGDDQPPGAPLLDPAQAARELGERYVLLMRSDPSGVQPRLNDLLLAADAAVLGDSSLRFDFALTRRPMLFGVPEGPVYDRLRPEHPDIEQIAPGPHVATTAEAVRKLKDLEAVRREYADDVEAFVADYVDLADDRSAARVVEAVFGTRDGGAR